MIADGFFFTHMMFKPHDNATCICTTCILPADVIEIVQGWWHWAMSHMTRWSLCNKQLLSVSIIPEHNTCTSVGQSTCTHHHDCLLLLIVFAPQWIFLGPYLMNCAYCKYIHPLYSRYLPHHNKYHEFHETCHSITFHFMKKDSKRCCDTIMPESIHTKDESKRDSAFAFIFGVNWPVQWM